MKQSLIGINILVSKPATVKIKRASTGTVLLQYVTELEFKWVGDNSSAILIEKNDLKIDCPVAYEYRLCWADTGWTKWSKEAPMNEQLKIELLKKQIEQIDNETRRETDLRIEEARIKKVKILNEIKLLENSINRYPSLDKLFYFLNPKDYALGLWTTSSGQRYNITDMSTSHIKACLEYLNDADTRLREKRDMIRMKRDEFEGELRFNRK